MNRFRVVEVQVFSGMDDLSTSIDGEACNPELYVYNSWYQQCLPPFDNDYWWIAETDCPESEIPAEFCGMANTGCFDYEDQEDYWCDCKDGYMRVPDSINGFKCAAPTTCPKSLPSEFLRVL